MFDDDFAMALAAARRSTARAVTRTYSAGQPRPAAAFTPPPRTTARTDPDRPGHRECSACGQMKPPSEFYAGRAKCKTCHQATNLAAQRRRAQAKPRKQPGRPRKPRTTPDSKRCSRCRDEKPAGEFYADRRTCDGLQSACKRCVASARRGTQA